MPESTNAGFCPLCHNHCPLSSPNCGRGAAYAAGAQEPASGPAASAGSMDRHEQGLRPGGGFSDCPPEDAPVSEQLLFQLRFCGHFLHHQAEPRGGQRRILSILAQRNSMSQRELMDMLDVRAGSLSEILGKLEDRGYVTRTRSETDHRAMELTLTASGQAALGEMDRQGDSTALLSVLTEAEQEQLTALLSKLTAAWREMREDPAHGVPEGPGDRRERREDRRENRRHGGHHGRGGPFGPGGHGR